MYYISLRDPVRTHPTQSRLLRGTTPSAETRNSMGSLCSKSSNHQGGHVVLGTSNTTGGNPTNRNVTGGGAPTSARDPRTAAAEAAERRMQAVSL
jgi:hypothetical protein